MPPPSVSRKQAPFSQETSPTTENPKSPPNWRCCAPIKSPISRPAICAKKTPRWRRQKSIKWAEPFHACPHPTQAKLLFRHTELLSCTSLFSQKDGICPHCPHCRSPAYTDGGAAVGPALLSSCPRCTLLRVRRAALSFWALTIRTPPRLGHALKTQYKGTNYWRSQESCQAVQDWKQIFDDLVSPSYRKTTQGLIYRHRASPSKTM